MDESERDSGTSHDEDDEEPEDEEEPDTEGLCRELVQGNRKIRRQLV